MNEYLKRQTEQMLNAAKDARIPENVQAFAEESVARSRETYGRLTAVAKDQARVAEDVLLASQAGARVIGAKLLDNTAANATAAFDAAAAVARAGSLAEAARLQAEFMQRQMAVAGAQVKELFELSTRITHETLATMSTAATKSFEQGPGRKG